MSTGLLWLQWRLYGGPLLSGYGSVEELFLLSNVMPNLRGYAGRLVAGEAPALALAMLSLAFLALARRAAFLTGLFRPTVIASSTAASVLIVYLPYGVFSEWSYLRFFLPALPSAFVLVAAHGNSLRALIKHLEEPRVHLIGAKSGGSVTLKLAADYPELVETLVAVTPPVVGPAGAVDWRKFIPGWEIYEVGGGS